MGKSYDCSKSSIPFRFQIVTRWAGVGSRRRAVTRASNVHRIKNQSDQRCQSWLRIVDLSLTKRLDRILQSLSSEVRHDPFALLAVSGPPGLTRGSCEIKTTRYLLFFEYILWSCSSSRPESSSYCVVAACGIESRISLHARLKLLPSILLALSIVTSSPPIPLVFSNLDFLKF